MLQNVIDHKILRRGDIRMKRGKQGKFGLKKTIVAAGVMIAASTLLFQGMTEAVTGAEFRKTGTVPANDAAYSAVSSRVPLGASSQVASQASSRTSSPEATNPAPESYVKGNYTVGDVDLEDGLNRSPSGNEISKEAAAEVGARALWRLFGVNLEGQHIEMGYQPANEVVPRARWYADVLLDGERRYSFSVDSVTGELLTIAVDRVLEADVSVDFDPALDKDPGAFVELAAQLAEKYGVVHGAVSSAQYAGQGYSNNDPTISVEIFGENGEVALMTFSRYDQALRGISYHPEYKAVRDYSEKLLQRFREKASELEKQASEDGKATPQLKAIELD